MRFVNLLPHSVTIYDEGVVDVIIPPSGWSLQLDIREGRIAQMFNGVPIYEPNTLRGAWLVKGKRRKRIPSPRRDTMYIITSRQAEMLIRPDILVGKTAPFENPEKVDGKLRSIRGVRRV